MSVSLPPKTKKLKDREECEMLEKVLPAFQVQILTRPAIQVQTLNKLVSDIFLWLLTAFLGKTAGVCECSEDTQKLKPRQNIHQLSSW
jgi:hypothetical protein